MTRICCSVFMSAIFFCGAVALSTCAAFAYDDVVAQHCTDDYMAYCSSHDPDSSATRRCMETHRSELSQRCVKALVAAGEVPAKYLDGDKHKQRASDR